MDADVTSHLVDTALLGTLYARPRPLPRVLDGTRALCQPWIDPADAFLVGRVEAGLRAGWMCLREPDAPTATTPAGLHATEHGRQRFEAELCRPLVRACHPHRVLQEQLRLSFIDQLPMDRQVQLAIELRQDRRRCLVCLGNRLETIGDGPERRLAQERRRQLEVEASALDRRLRELGLLAEPA
ncbi:hypothetical protein [Geminicoccus harenae]|uniref:hypothetical protein n=1 Tax=Geminicoccus harenae TaxID=2498453 RepID=UPI00168AE875|nr:hypothetical protein [Geminicoccus harenae]